MGGTWIRAILKNIALHMFSDLRGNTFFKTYFENHTPGAAFGAAPACCRALGRGIFEPVSKKSAPGDLGRGIFEPGSKNQPRGPGRGFLKLGTGTPFLNRTILKFWDRFLWGTQHPSCEISRPQKIQMCSHTSSEGFWTTHVQGWF